LANEIFISYRRADAGWAGRIYDHLADEFKPGELFMDVESIVAGHNFDNTIKMRAENAKVMLAIIADNWAMDANIRRLDTSDDYVRKELEIGLHKRRGGVIPVIIEPLQHLVGVAERLPESLRGLALLQALRITHKGFKTDAQELVNAIKHKLDELAGGARRHWDRTLFLDAAREARGEHLVKRFIKVIDWAREKYALQWGNGAKYGTAQIMPRGGSSTAFSIDHTGTFFVFMRGLERMGAFKSLDDRQKFVNLLNNVQGIAISKERTTNDYIGFQIRHVDLEDMDQLLAIFDAEMAKLTSSG